MVSIMDVSERIRGAGTPGRGGAWQGGGCAESLLLSLYRAPKLCVAGCWGGMCCA